MFLQTMLQTSKKHCSFHCRDILLRLKQNEKTALKKSDSETVEDEEDTLEFPYDHFPTLDHCYAHTIQLVEKDGLSEKLVNI